MKTLLIVLSILIFNSQLFAKTWHNKEFNSNEGVKVTISYQLVESSEFGNPPYLYKSVYPLHFRVQGDLINADSDVRVVFINTMEDQEICGRPKQSFDEVYYMDLKRFSTDDNFEGYLIRTGLTSYDSPIRQIDLWRKSYCREQIALGQEFAVVIDGYWLKDSISKGSNFKLEL